MILDPEIVFEQELEYFRREVQGGIQLFFADLTFHTVVHDKPSILKRLNETSLFWNSTLYAWQSGYFITLGRIFDRSSPHNVNRLMEIAVQHPAIFSKEALAARKQRDSANADEWLPEYLKRVCVPSTSDLKRLENTLARYRRRYEKSYKGLRDKVFAHRDLVETKEVQELFSNTTIREFKGIYIFLAKLHEAFWELFNNGRKPNLRPQPHSVRRFLSSRRSSWQSPRIQEIIVKETQRVLVQLGDYNERPT